MVQGSEHEYLHTLTTSSGSPGDHGGRRVYPVKKKKKNQNMEKSPELSLSLSLSRAGGVLLEAFTLSAIYRVNLDPVLLSAILDLKDIPLSSSLLLYIPLSAFANKSTIRILVQLLFHKSIDTPSKLNQIPNEWIILFTYTDMNKILALV